LRPATFIKYLQKKKKFFFAPIEYSGMPAQRGICIVNNVIATKVIILIESDGNVKICDCINVLADDLLSATLYVARRIVMRLQSDPQDHLGGPSLFQTVRAGRTENGTQQ
jgi:hypothetical protein